MYRLAASIFVQQLCQTSQVQLLPDRSASTNDYARFKRLPATCLPLSASIVVELTTLDNRLTGECFDRFTQWLEVVQWFLQRFDGVAETAEDQSMSIPGMLPAERASERYE